VFSAGKGGANFGFQRAHKSPDAKVLATPLAGTANRILGRGFFAGWRNHTRGNGYFGTGGGGGAFAARGVGSQDSGSLLAIRPGGRGSCTKTSFSDGTFLFGAGAGAEKHPMDNTNTRPGISGGGEKTHFHSFLSGNAQLPISARPKANLLRGPGRHRGEIFGQGGENLVFRGAIEQTELLEGLPGRRDGEDWRGPTPHGR